MHHYYLEVLLRHWQNSGRKGYSLLSIITPVRFSVLAMAPCPCSPSTESGRLSSAADPVLSESVCTSNRHFGDRERRVGSGRDWAKTGTRGPRWASVYHKTWRCNGGKMAEREKSVFLYARVVVPSCSAHANQARGEKLLGVGSRCSIGKHASSLIWAS